MYLQYMYAWHLFGCIEEHSLCRYTVFIHRYMYFNCILNDAHRKNHTDKLTHQLRMLKGDLGNEIERCFYFENLSERSLKETRSVWGWRNHPHLHFFLCKLKPVIKTSFTWEINSDHNTISHDCFINLLKTPSVNFTFTTS